MKLEVDVDSSASVDRAFQASAKYFGPDHHIDVVVNNAGYSLSGDSEGVTEQEMHQQLEVNFFGTVRVTLAAIKVMREEKNGRGGLIFNISSLAGVVAFPGHSFYHASKFAVEGWSESVVKELHPDWNSEYSFLLCCPLEANTYDAVHLCIIEPGPIDTNFEGSSKVHMKPHPAYATSDMPSRQLEAFVKAGLDEGVGAKPLVIAKTLVHVAERNEKVPLHLPLTLAATHLIKMKLEARLKALEDVKELSAIDRDVAQFDVTQL